MGNHEKVRHNFILSPVCGPSSGTWRSKNCVLQSLVQCSDTILRTNATHI